MKPIRPIVELGSRPPEAGRIRSGVKTARAMKAIDTWRFTSPHRDCIDQLAALYGGQPKVWVEPKASVKHQHELITESRAIRVFVPPGGITQFYELWEGSGCARRCDGIEVETMSKHGDPVVSPCLCQRENEMKCRPYTRLSVVIPDITFRGVWRLETKSWNAADELPAMEALIDSLQSEQAIVEAELLLEQRSRVTSQGKRNFVVPVLNLTSSAEQLSSGAVGLGAATAAGLPASTTPNVEDQPPPALSSPDETPVAEVLVNAEDIVAECKRVANHLLFAPGEFLAAVCLGISKGEHRFPTELDDDQLLAADQFLADVMAETIIVNGFNHDGRLLITRKE